jgi:hypothetical protein
MLPKPEEPRRPAVRRTLIRLKQSLSANEEVKTVLLDNLGAFDAAFALGTLQELTASLDAWASTGGIVTSTENAAICHLPGRVPWVDQYKEMAMASSESLDGLLKRMPQIAKAVSAFPEAVQQSAFEALMAAAGAETPPATASTSNDTTAPKPRSRRNKPPAEGGTGRVRRTSGSPSVIRDLDLTPKGKTSLKDFVAAKQPKTQHDYNSLSVYYFAEELGIAAVTLNHIFTAYKDMKWREPASLSNSLSLTSVRKRFLDTSNMDDIKLTPAGRNHVQHDLPPKRKGK